MAMVSNADAANEEMEFTGKANLDEYVGDTRPG
jgi:hypothetical protein